MLQPAGLLLLLFLLYKKSDLDLVVALAVCASLFVTAGFFVSIGSVEVSYGDFLVLYSCIIFLFSRNRRIDLRLFTRVGLFWLLFVLSYLSVTLGFANSTLVYANGWDYAFGTLSHPAVTMSNLKEIINVLMFGVLVMVFRVVDKEKLIERFIFAGKVILVLVIAEYVSKQYFDSDYFLRTVAWFFGTGVFQIDFLFERGLYYGLQGLTREPSQLSRGLLLWLLVVVVRRREAKWAALCVVELLISGSFAGAVFTMFVFLFFLFHNFGFKHIRSVFFLGLFFAGLLSFLDLSYYWSRLEGLFLDLRVLSILQSVDVFIKNPLLGVGLGNSMSFSGSLTLLSNLGLLGTFVWVYMCKYGYQYTYRGYWFMFLLFCLYVFVGGKDTVYGAPTLLIFLILDDRILNYGSRIPGERRRIRDFIASSTRHLPRS